MTIERAWAQDHRPRESGLDVLLPHALEELHEERAACGRSPGARATWLLRAAAVLERAVRSDRSLEQELTPVIERSRVAAQGLLRDLVATVVADVGRELGADLVGLPTVEDLLSVAERWSDAA